MNVTFSTGDSFCPRGTVGNPFDGINGEKKGKGGCLNGKMVGDLSFEDSLMASMQTSL